MERSRKWDIGATAAVTATIVALVLAPMVTLPGAKVEGPPAADCATAVNQLEELDQYGSVWISYSTSSWKPYNEELWTAKFKTEPQYRTYEAKVKFSTDVQGKTMCDAVDKLYYKVMEYPLPKVEWHRD